MAANSGTDSVGLKGAKMIGDERVSSLLEFSWANRHDSNVRLVNPAIAVDKETSSPNGESAVSGKGHREADKRAG